MDVFIAQIFLEIQQNLWKCKFSNFCVFVKKCWYHYTKTLKMQKLEKVILFILNHISSKFWATETYYTSFWSSWPIVLTSSLTFDSRSDRFWGMKKNTSPDNYETPSSNLEVNVILGRSNGQEKPYMQTVCRSGYCLLLRLNRQMLG